MAFGNTTKLEAIKAILLCKKNEVNDAIKVNTIFSSKKSYKKQKVHKSFFLKAKHLFAFC